MVRAVAAAVVALAWVASGDTAQAGVRPMVDRGTERWDLFGLEPRGAAFPHTLVKPGASRRYPYLPDEAPGRSMSVGTVTDGHMVNGAPLPFPGRTYGVLPRQVRRNLVYGSQELIAALVDASEYVAEVYPGSVLWLGNVGREHGGDIPWSVSHNSGRDADVAFYTTDPSGVPVQPPDLLHYRGDGRTVEYGGYYRFDDARNWALVKALVTSQRTQVQYLFISNPLRQRLLSHARSRGEPAAIVERAASLMQQPGAEIPHDDHLHVRVYCSREDVGAGCVNIGRVRPGVDLFAGAQSERAAYAVSLLRDGDPEVRRTVVERLALLGARAELEMIRRRLSDPSPVVRAAAVDAIGALGTSSSVGWLVLQWEEERDDYVRERIVRAAGRLGGREAGILFAGLLAEPIPIEVGGKGYDLRLEVVDAIRRSGRAEPAYGLVELLASSDRELAARSAGALRHLANRSVDDLDWRQRPSEIELTVAVPAWRSWLDAASTATRDEWVSEGFAMLGVPMGGSARTAAASLAALVADERDWVSDNAQRQLMRMTGNHPRSLEWPREDARAYWTRWVRRNPERVAWR